MNSFDAYDVGDVVRLYFAFDDYDADSPAAYQDVVVTDTTRDAIRGYKAGVSDKTHGSLTDTDADTPTHGVRIDDAVIDVRTKAVVMKRTFGQVDDPIITVTKSNADEFTTDGGT